MNFFVQQEEARRRSRRLIWLFHLVVVLTALVTTLFYWCYVKFFTGEYTFETSLLAQTLTHPQSWGIFATVYAMVWGVALIRSLPLRQGGEVVARLAGGSVVALHTPELAERKLVNVVEEMSLASGVPIPSIFVLKNEASINAFAAGLGTHDACIAVSQGALDKLTRDELQGVVAHEFSHILNGDMRLNLQLLGYLYGLTSISDVGRYLMRRSTLHSRRRSYHADLLGLGVFLIGSVGYLFGLILKSAISRDRERLADASAVQFTRNPEGLGGALRKIFRDGGAVIQAPRAAEISHFYFHWGKGSELFATHPSISERIQALGLDATEIKGRAPQVERVAESAVMGLAPQVLTPNVHPATLGLLFFYWFEPSPGIGPIELVNRWSPQLGQNGLQELYDQLTSADPSAVFQRFEETLYQLRLLEKAQRRELLGQLKELIESDRFVSVREFLYYRLLQLELLPPVRVQKKPREEDLRAALRCTAAFMAALVPLSSRGEWVKLVTGSRSTEVQGQVGLKEVQAAMGILGQALPSRRGQIFQSFREAFEVVSGKDVEQEFALRLLALVLEVPLPPVVSRRALDLGSVRDKLEQ